MSGSQADIYAVIVLFKKKLGDSITFRTIVKAIEESGINIRMLIYNNSPSYSDVNLEVPTNIGLEFENDNENSGVSKAYNLAAYNAQKLGAKWLLLLDQDSELPVDFFKVFIKAQRSNKHVDLFVPVVMSAGKIISPATYIMYRGLIKDRIRPGIHNLGSLALINSCSFISVKSFALTGGFHSEINLDFSDVYFFGKLKTIVRSVYILDVVCQHGFSGLDYSNREQAIARYLLYIKNARAFKKYGDVVVCFLLLTVVIRTFNLCYRFKTTKFLSILAGHEK